MGVDEVSEPAVVASIIDRFREEIDGDVTEVVRVGAAAAEPEATVADGTVVLVLREEIDSDEDAMELVVSASEAGVTVADGTVVLVLSEVVVDVDSPLFDFVLAGEELSTPLEKMRIQASTAMP